MGFVEPTKFTWVVDPESGRRVKKASRGTKWKARYTDPAGRDRRRTFDRRSDAERFLERIGTSMQTGEWVDPRADKSRFDEWADTWWATTVKLAPSTRRGYERMLRVHLTPRFSGRKINSIDWVEIELFATSMLDGGSSSKTVRQTISVLSLIMQTAMRARVLRENPAAGHSIPQRRKRVRVLTMAEIDRLATHADERYRAAIWLLALTGLRTSELCGLRLMDVDWEQGSVTVNEVQMWVGGQLVVKGPKTESGIRTVPIPAWLLNALREAVDHRAQRAGEPVLATDRLFTSPTGKPILDHTLWRVISQARLAAGLPRFRPYDLRHSHASLLIELGAHPKMISERMGHTEIGVTMNVYGHLFSGAQHRLTEQLDALLEQTRSTATEAKHDAAPKRSAVPTADEEGAS